MTSPRIVVTGAKDGKSVVVSDGEATTFGIPLMPGSDYTPVWAADETPVVPDSAQAAQPRTYFPPAGGFRFCFFTLGPGTATLPDDFDAAAAAGQVQRDIPGLLDVFEADNPGMHTSDTVDVDFVLSGEVDVELDDGVEVHLKAGDVLVQHGTRHAWRNKSAEPCVLVVAVTGARRA
jgi:mannose-6-phosphate isomerase-like protein (cupin superfamily)